jgi:hypothetical protein
MKTAILAVLLLVSISAVADPWSTGDIVREVTFQSLWAIDFLQTRNISKSAVKKVIYCGNSPCITYTDSTSFENNSLLGNHPSLGDVNRYFLVGSAFHAGISYVLPENMVLPFGIGSVPIRAPFQYISIGVEGGYVAHNFRLGISAKF